MSRYSPFFTIALTLLCVSFSYAQIPVFSEHFSVSEDTSFSKAGWKGLVGPLAEDVSDVPIDGHKIALSGGVGYVFSLAIGRELFVYTEKSPFGVASPAHVFGDLREIVLGVANATPAENIRIAVRAGSDWYLSDQVLNHSTGTSSLQNTESKGLDLATATWRHFAAERGKGFKIGNSASIEDNEPITAVGLFNVVDNRLRVTHFQVNSDSGNYAEHFSLEPNPLDYEDTEKFGLPVLSAEQWVVHQAGELDVYQTHQMPLVTTFNDFIYVFWIKHLSDESRPDGRFVYSRSKDGSSWSTPTVVATRGMLSEDPTRVPTPPAVFSYAERLYFLAGLNHRDIFLLSTEDGNNWSEPVHFRKDFAAFEAPSKLNSGRWIWLGQGMQRRTLEASFADGDPTEPGNWRQSQILNPRPVERRWVEPAHFIRPGDGAVVAVTRPGRSSNTLFSAVSLDEGETYTKTDTNFPDAMSRPAAGNLPDGQVYILNNPGRQGDRSILTIALSRDGRVFDRMFALGFNTPPIRWPGYGKPLSLGGYQHPQAIVWNDALLVVCTRNKEDIVVFKIPLENLK